MSKEKLAEGKTKIILQDINPLNVLIMSKDDITAGDGEKCHVLPGKGIYSTDTTCAIFSLLSKRGIPNHFIEKSSPSVFRARKLKMIPIEVVARRIAYGSYLKRHPEVKRKMKFNGIVVESFYKDDSLHDPFLMFDEDNGIWNFYDAKKPTDKGFLGTLDKGRLPTDREIVLKMEKLARRAFYVVEEAWQRFDITLVDMKLEFGFDAETGELLIGDVADNDSWRLWLRGDEKQKLDKDVYREMDPVTPEGLEIIRRNYAFVAEKACSFNDVT